MKIGQFASSRGISVRMLRYYEQSGVLVPGRTASGYREYGDKEARTFEAIRLLASTGMTLAGIREVLPCVRPDNGSIEMCERVRRLLREQESKLALATDAITARRRALAALTVDSN